MKLVDEIFRNCIFKEDALVNYGFILNNGTFIYNKKIHKDKFELNLKIKSGIIDGKLIDLDFNDEYTQINIEGEVGSFIGDLRMEVEDILLDIKNKCCSKEAFVSFQANEVAKYIKNTYNIDPEFLFKTSPDCGVFRRNINNKWFGIIMNINSNRLGLKDNRMVDVINVKVEDKKASNYIDNVGIFKAYHMNHENWISIILDGSVNNEKVFSLIDKSYNIIKKGDAWIVPANPKYYDVIAAFKNSKVIIWKQSTDISVGDIIYMYVASPYSSVLYKCEATEVNIPYEYKDKNVRMSYIMKIKLIEKYEKDKYSMAFLEKNGIRAVRGPRKIDESIFNK